jgi:hypothetical protein
VTFGTWAFSILAATGAAPFLVAAVSVALQFLTGRASLYATLKNALVAPVEAVFMMIFFALPVIAVTAAFSGGALVFRRFVTTSTTPLWIIAGLCLVYMPIALGRYSGGDGGSMRSFGEMLKATIAGGVACWSTYAAMRLWGEI